MEHEGMMKGHMMCPICMGIVTEMTRVSMVATPEGGAIVSAGDRLTKYDAQLNVVRQVDLPLDIEQMHRQMMEMTESPLHEEMRKKWQEMMAQRGEEGGAEPPGPPGYRHHGRR
jgi:hypothetical protein